MNVTDLPERIAAKIGVDGATGCWLWNGGTQSRGYGTHPWEGRSVMAHRLVYHLLADRTLPVRPGSAHVGLQLDHLCRTRNCVNPDHLEPVTHGENVRRALLLDLPHGVLTVYERGCRCTDCRAANAARARDYDRRRREARTA